MGYLRPTAIIVTGSYSVGISNGTDDQRHWAEVAHEQALEIFGSHGFLSLVSDLLPETVNYTRSFLVAWDGSKEGWLLSDRADRARAEFVAWLREQAYEDNSSPLDWVEIQYGGDDREVVALAHDGEMAVA